MDKETWYEVEYSRTGEDDWYSAGPNSHADTVEAARRNAEALATSRRGKKAQPEFEFRVVRKTMTTEKVEDE